MDLRKVLPPVSEEQYKKGVTQLTVALIQLHNDRAEAILNEATSKNGNLKKAYKEAAQCWEQAKQLGSAHASNRLGDFWEFLSREYQDRLNTKIDFLQQALKFYKMAIEYGSKKMVTWKMLINGLP